MQAPSVKDAKLFPFSKNLTGLLPYLKERIQKSQNIATLLRQLSLKESEADRILSHPCGFDPYAVLNPPLFLSMYL